MPAEDNRILKYNQCAKYMNVPFTIYADLESLLEKMNTCHNNPRQKRTLVISQQQLK